MKTYFINSKKENCGVYQMGLRIWDAVKNTKLNIQYKEIESREEFLKLDFENVDLLFFNWIEAGSNGPFGWYDYNMINYLKTNYDIKTATIVHINHFNTAKFDYYIDQDPKNEGLTRPLYEYNKPKIKNSVPNICSFGFAFDHKGFDDVVRKVNNEMDQAVINLHITNAHYGDADSNIQRHIIDNIKSIPLKSGISLNITTDFKSNEEMLDFVNGNDLLILAYRLGEGLSGIPDYAISTNTPLAVTNIDQFKHVYTQEIDVNLNTIPSIFNFYQSSDYLTNFKSLWSREKLLSTFENFVKKVCNEFTTKSYSQVNQDRFVLKIVGNNGYFLDIGAGWDDSGINSNTLLLEQNGWTGICIEGDPTSANRRSLLKKNSIVECVYVPQTHIVDILKKNSAPKTIDYVSIDIEPSSLIALQNFPFKEYDLKVLTFEHDLYRLGDEQKNAAYQILSNEGYVRLCDNVKVTPTQANDLYYEDWYINPKYFSKEFIDRNKFTCNHGSEIVDKINCEFK